MALDPNVVVVAPGELITADHLNDIRANLDRIDTVTTEARLQSLALGPDTGITGPATITGSGFTLPRPTHRYMLTMACQVFKGSTAGTVTIAPNPAIPNHLPLYVTLANGEARSLSYSWSVAGTATGGAFTITPSAGTVNLEVGSRLFIADMGLL